MLFFLVLFHGLIQSAAIDSWELWTIVVNCVGN